MAGNGMSALLGYLAENSNLPFTTVPLNKQSPGHPAEWPQTDGQVQESGVLHAYITQSYIFSFLHLG